MLCARPPVEVEVLLYLRLLLPLGRLVDRELHAPRAVLHHLRHEGRVFGGDILVVERDKLTETHDTSVIVDPLVHLSQLYIEHDMVNSCHTRRRPLDVALMVAWHERARVIIPIDERVNSITTGSDGSLADAPLLTLDSDRLQHALRASLDRRMVSIINIGHAQGDILHAVTVQAHMVGYLALRVHGSGHYHTNLILLKHVGSTVAHFGLRPRVCGDIESHHATIELSGLLGVAHVKLYVIYPLDREAILLFGASLFRGRLHRPIT